MSENFTLIKKSYKEIQVSVTCVSAITKAYFMIKANRADPDASALVTKTITSASAAAGQITTAGPPTATLKFYILETDLDSLNDIQYPWDIKCISNSHAYKPPEANGVVSINQASILAVN
jgi:hypothetical protein